MESSPCDGGGSKVVSPVNKNQSSDCSRGSLRSEKSWWRKLVIESLIVFPSPGKYTSMSRGVRLFME